MSIENHIKVQDPKASSKSEVKTKRFRGIRKNWDLYLLITPVVIYFLIFHYWPMYGVQIAFKDYIGSKGIWGSPWVGVRHFQRFFRSYHFWPLIRNTLTLSLYYLAIGFPIPILLALMMNEVKNKAFKKTIQTVTYAPHFLSTVVLVGMFTVMLAPKYGLVNQIRESFGYTKIYFMADAKWFKWIYVWSGIWQHAGWNSIIYMAALAGIDIQLYEAAIVDGASKWQRIWNVTVPGILPTAIILLILNVGQIMSVGFEKVFLMQNDLNLPVSDIISTYVYRTGLLGAQYSFSAAVGLFNSIINFILIIAINQISKKVSEVSLW